MFLTPKQSHQHSLKTLELLYEYDDFMESIGTLIDFGCGQGLDLEWWATRTTRDEQQTPLNIKCTGVDLAPELKIAKQYNNIQYSSQNFEEPITMHKRTYDIAWCHNSFQYVLDPFKTLQNWYSAISDGGMLILVLPQTTNIEFNIQAFDQYDFSYYHWTLPSLIHVLSVSGFNCADGFFYKGPEDPWLHAAVYKSNTGPLDPRTTKWYDLADLGLLPESAVKSIEQYGYLRQRDLVLPWLDKNSHWYGLH